MQKRIIRKLDLELFLSEIGSHRIPKPELEQYTIPVDVAASMLYIAAYTNDDIVGKTVVDLGCGTGRLALGAAFLGAKQVVGVDIDRETLRTAFENSKRLNLAEVAQFIVADVDAVVVNFDTVLQNPPYGVQKRGADRKFLKRAIEIGKVVYSLHKSSLRSSFPSKKVRANGSRSVDADPFLRRFIAKQGACIETVYPMRMTIPYMFKFHSKRKHEFPVDLYVIRQKQKS